MNAQIKRKDKGLLAVKTLVFFFLCFGLLFPYTARAKEALLTKTQESLFVGDSLLLSDYFAESYKDKDLNAAYEISAESENVGCVSVSSAGKITAKSAGTAIVVITYHLPDSTEEISEDFSITVLDAEQITAGYGDVIWLSAFDYYSPFAKDADAYTYSFSSNSGIFDDSGSGILVQGFSAFSVYLERGSKSFTVAEVNVATPAFEKEAYARATETDALELVFKNYTKISGQEVVTYSVDDASVATVTQDGLVTALEIGSTKINAELHTIGGEVLNISAKLTVTDPTASKKRLVVARGIYKELPIAGVCEDSTYQTADGTDEFTYALLTDAGKVFGQEKGSEKITVVVDGREVALRLIITDPRYNKLTFSLCKGKEKQLPIKGINQTYSKLSYKSLDKSVAKVKKDGTVKGKKVGVTEIEVTADEKTFTVHVEVASKKGWKAAKKAIAISKQNTHYSQAKRMSTGYYDCSSLVSRVYRQCGVYFGSKSGWSPTAAGIGQWCANNGKVISYGSVPYTDLVPGDIICYSYTQNGRYKNISHIEIYVGNGKNVAASSSNDAVIWYDYSDSCSVLVARPSGKIQ